MIIGMMLGLVVFGVLTMIRGRMKVSGSKEVRGIPALFLGFVALTPFPIAMVITMIAMAMDIDLNRPDLIEKWEKDNKLLAVGIQGGSAVGIGIFIFVLGAILGKPPIVEAPKSSKGREYDDEEPDQHREYDDYDDEQPQRRKPKVDRDDDGYERR